MKRIREVLTVLALLATVAAVAPAVHAYSTIASAYGSKNNQYMTAYTPASSGLTCHLVGAGGAPVGDAITVSSDVTAGNPAIVYDSVLDRFLVAWGELNGGSSYLVKGRILASDGSLVGSEIAIGSDSNNQGTIKIAYSPVSGRYLVVFSQGPTGMDNISGQFIKGDGTLYGVNFTAISGATLAESPNVSFDSVNDRFLVVALTHGGSWPPVSVTGVILNDDIQVFKSSFSILDPTNTYLYPPAIAYNPVTSQFLVAWEVYFGDGHQLWGQLIDADGTLSGTSQVIVTPHTVNQGNDLIYQSGNGRFLAAWFDSADGINGQEVSSDGTNYGSEFSIVSSVQRDFALSYNSALKNTLIAYEISGTPPHYTTIGGPSFQGTIGTSLPSWRRVRRQERKGAIGKASAKVITWQTDAITLTATTIPLPAGNYDVTVKPVPSKTPPITFPKAFTVMSPEIDSLSITHGTPLTEITITGKFFGTTRGTVYLEYQKGGRTLKKNCTVKSWKMDPTTGASQIDFLVPKGLAPSAYTLRTSPTPLTPRPLPPPYRIVYDPGEKGYSDPK